MAPATVRESCHLSADPGAASWLGEHPEVSRIFIAYMSSRACCSGATVCDVRIRVEAQTSRWTAGAESWTSLGSFEGRDVFIDSRLVDRMPTRMQLRVRGVGRFRRLDLDMTGEQWAELLYPSPR